MGKKINIDKRSRQTQFVGYLRNEVIDQLALELTHREIIIYPGTIKHIRHRHHYTFKKYFHRLIDVIKSPDYIGRVKTNPYKIMLIKRYKDTILVALKIEGNSIILISSMYIVKQNTVEKKIETGEIYKLNISTTSYGQKKHYKNIKRHK